MVCRWLRSRSLNPLAIVFVATASGFSPSTLIDKSAVEFGRTRRLSPVLQMSKQDDNKLREVSNPLLPKSTKDVEVSTHPNYFSLISPIAATVSLAILVQLPLVPPSGASSYGQFSNEVNPAKVAPIIGRGKAQDKLKESCERFGSSSTSINKQVLSKKCSVEVEDPNLERVMEHERLAENLAKEPDWFNYAAAFMASVTSTLIIHPLDTIKVRLMAKGKDEDEDLGPDYSGREGEADPTAIASTAISLSHQDVGKNESIAANIRSLYNGILPNIAKEGPPSALYLGLYESFVVILKQYPFFAEHNVLMFLFAGAIGELVGSIVRAPAEGVKTRVQTGYSLSDAIHAVFLTDDGRINTIKAWSSSCFRDVPAGAIQIGIFEALKLFLISTPYIDIDVDTLLSESLLGGIGGGIGAFVTTPSDRVTTTIISSTDEEISLLDCVSKILKEEGPRGLFVGWSQRTSYWFFAVGIFLSVYCALRQAAIPLFL